MRHILPGLIVGLLFGAGLALSEMINPARVLGFLDPFGHWDPTLAFVMGGALVVTAPGFALLRRRQTTLLGDTLTWSDATAIDAPLIGGAALFGIGWGLVGLCPGPALVNLASLSPKVLGFVVAMAIGARLRDLLRHRRAGQLQDA